MAGIFQAQAHQARIEEMFLLSCINVYYSPQGLMIIWFVDLLIHQYVGLKLKLSALHVQHRD